MKLYAFQNKRTKKLVTGTDFTTFPRRQICDEESPPMLLTKEEITLYDKLKFTTRQRHINFSTYNLVECELSVIKPVRKNEIEKMIKGEWE